MRQGSDWYKREPASYLGGVQGLTAKEHAVYSVTVDLIYQHGGSVNNDPSWIAGWIKDMGSAAVRKTISSLCERGKLQIEGDQITQKRAKNEAKTKENLRENARKNGEKGGKKSAEIRAANKKNNDLAEAPASTEIQADKIREDKSTTEVTSVTSSRLSKDEGFVDFWKIWPSKKNKKDALTAWRKLSIECKREAYAAVKSGWFERWQSESRDRNPIHASTFLNKRRWEDQQSQLKLHPIEGGRTDESTSRSQERVNAFVSGARGSS